MVWSADTTDKEGRPVRDPDSATYNAAIETIATRGTDPEPAPFAKRIRREAERRGFHTAPRQVVLGDGAPWIWNFADEHFPDAVQIVDIFHAKGHLFEVAKAIYGPGSEVGERWAKQRREELDEGRVDDVIGALRSHAGSCEEARRDVEYFSNNRERMNYPTFRAMGLCVATGVVEGGCKQAHHRDPSQARRHALDRRWRQRHHRPEMRRREPPLRRLLGTTGRRTIVNLTNVTYTLPGRRLQPGRRRRTADAAHAFTRRDPESGGSR